MCRSLYRMRKGFSILFQSQIETGFIETLNHQESAMTQPLTFVILSTGLDSFKEIRSALASDKRARLLAGGNDAEQLYEEIVRLKPDAAIITLGANIEQAIKLMERLSQEYPQSD